MFLKHLWPFWRKKKRKQNHRPTDHALNTLERVYTQVGQLELGMYVAELDRPWLETPFMFQGFELKTPEDIKAIRACCDYVYIDLTKRKRTPPANAPTTRVPTNKAAHFAPPPPRLSVFEKEFSRAESVHENTGMVIADFMEKVANGGNLDSKLAKDAVAECVNSVLHSPDAMLWLSQLKERDRYTAQHSLNVCILSIVLGRHLNYSEAALNVVGLCGMMHDMGKMLIPLSILNKPGRLEGEEVTIMQSHTTLGYELLKSSDNMHPNAMETALIHHERSDGKGYPRQIKPVGVSEFAKIVTVADMYDAMTSDRVYQKGRTHLEAINIMTNMSGTHLDAALVVKFIESQGVYPPGSLVEMTNGSVGIVFECNEKLKLRPKVIMILNEHKQPAQEFVLDLAKMVKDSHGNIYTIKSMIRAEDWNIDTQKYNRQTILQKVLLMNA